MMARLSALMLCTFSIAWMPATTENLELTGRWVIEIADPAEDETFSGTAIIQATNDASVFEATLITEDSCCNGNYSKVRQKSMITVDGMEIEVLSEIEEFLIQEDLIPGISYTKDDFQLEMQDDGTLFGLINGWTYVRWTRVIDSLV